MVKPTAYGTALYSQTLTIQNYQNLSSQNDPHTKVSSSAILRLSLQYFGWENKTESRTDHCSSNLKTKKSGATRSPNGDETSDNPYVKGKTNLITQSMGTWRRRKPRVDYLTKSPGPPRALKDSPQDNMNKKLRVPTRRS